MKSIEQNKIISSLIFSILNFILALILINSKSNINLSTYLSTIQLVIGVLFIKINKSKLISIAIIFLLLSYLFHFGQAVIIAYGFRDIYAHRSVLSLTSPDLFLGAINFAMISNYFLTIGIVWSKSYKRIIMKTDNDEESMLKTIRTISLIILVLTFIPLVYLDIQKIIAVKISGYMSTYETYAFGINKYLNLIAQFARPALTMLLVSYKKNRKAANFVFGISSVYFAVMMLSGDRGTNMIYLLTNIFVYYKIIKKIKTRAIIVASILAYFFIGLVSTISILRDTSEISMAGLLYYYNYRSSDGIIYSVLREFGATIKTLIYAMQFTPEISDYNYGLTYLLSWLNISPKLPEQVVNYLSYSSTFTKSFPIEYQDSLGGSYLGELYYNFGWLGSFISMLIGRFIGSIDDIIEDSIRYNNWLIFSLLMILVPNIMLWVRGYFVELLFLGFWMGLITLVLYDVLSRKQRKLV